MAGRQAFSRIAVVEARGLAKSATHTVIALSRESKIRTYRTWDEFEAFCEASDDPRDKLAQQAIQRGRERYARSGTLERLLNKMRAKLRLTHRVVL